MDHFELKNGVLHAEDVPLPLIAAEVGTPVYVYSRATLTRHARVFRDALGILRNARIAFAVKSNPNLSVLKVLAAEGYGADVVSGGEMERALAAGMDPDGIVFSGVGKTAAEMRRGIEAGIGQFNLESEEEGLELAEIAASMGKVASAALRVNPDVDAGTHGKISTGKAENKFGVPFDRAAAIYARLAGTPGLNMRGLTLHIGSQLSKLEPLEAAFTKVGGLMEEIRAAGHTVTHMDLGGGIGVPYKQGEVFPQPEEYAAMVARVTGNWGVTLMFEPGRVITGNTGVLVTQVIRVKEGAGNPWVVVDAAMNDLARPALYDAWHDFVAVEPKGETVVANIVGPICESSDTFAMARTIDTVERGDLAVFRTAGAYGATMANTYNSRPLVPEVMVDGDKWAVVADRIDPATILAAERVPEWLA
ncbi:MAG: diaminopimelate decarboxylase [Novosphingobium sp. 28-62-57]|uniref:diaminopimelate decarboxylase n=1 Tax=unclassified Novosphingobium TaxID=2644732 RepID=UPI000BDB2BDA|nr:MULTISPECIES: diaminopimelate decarboxylase [unclassified Novosphingobium]OYW48564.1 MAG: diaminopimelate decarboxylase [Novosphingobium sp. 12-62-10]OYZ39112.1 MAG: diaminopimelate decarboxylase [Novosphingobium sp. 16-62-11]OZA31364.1 MAG: diaminopimelate decarboxylase [Novosphingobium sp. 17-62-9]OYZ08500.1 MAG: diaminopimelate decarboxylase [Novosphingobium sp. 28-62-57]HQS71326.1 diaminopimelate decarboxylase [Novosphingobium sp.]